LHTTITTELKNAFQVLSSEKPLTLYTKSEEGKQEWMRAIQSAIDALLQEQPHLKGTPRLHRLCRVSVMTPLALRTTAQRQSNKPTPISVGGKPQAVWRMIREHSRFKRSSGENNSSSNSSLATKTTNHHRRSPSSSSGTESSGKSAHIAESDEGREEGGSSTTSTASTPTALRRRSNTSTKLTREFANLSNPWAEPAKLAHQKEVHPQQLKKKNRMAISFKKLAVARDGIERDEILERGRDAPTLPSCPTSRKGLLQGGWGGGLQAASQQGQRRILRLPTASIAR